MGTEGTRVECGSGSGSVLVIAPHGGLSRGDLLASPGRSGNDLHTPALARDLVRALDASWVINASLDRNQLDLNRFDAVTGRARWFLEAIEERVQQITQRHGRVVVLVVHGWHVEQARCDLGIGARLETAGEGAGCSDRLTVGLDFLGGNLESFRQSLVSRAVLATYGERWPAAHRNNLMRIFRRRPDDRDPSPIIREAVAAGRLDAVQLELGAPLRWSGPLRSSLIEAARASFGSIGQSSGARASFGSIGRSSAAPADVDGTLVGEGTRSPLRAASVQAFDPESGDSGIGLVLGAMHISAKDVGARVQLFPGGQRMGIFTGHGRQGPRFGVPSLWFEPSGDGFEAHFDGHLLEARDAEAYFSSEPEQVRANLRETEIRLQFRPRLPGFGHLSGEVRFGDEHFSVDAPAFGDLRTDFRGGPRSGTRLLFSLDRDTALRLDRGEEGHWTLARLGPAGWEESRHGGHIEEEKPGRLVVHMEERAPTRVDLRTRASVLRPAGPGRWVHTTFGVARIDWESQRIGNGFYEERRPLGEDSNAG